MNKIILIGRLTRDPEVRYSQGENPKPIARYSIAVDKKYKRDDGVTADFFHLVAFDKFASFAEKYLRKGIKILVSGRVQTGTYENKDGVRIPFFEIVVEEQEFAESKAASQSQINSVAESINAGRNMEMPAPMPTKDYKDEGGFMYIPDDELEDLPFN